MAEVILALDLRDQLKALRLAETLRQELSWVKVGLEMFTRFGPHFVETLADMGFHIFLDLKFYDIPNTVKESVLGCAELHVDMLTLHLQGGLRMLEYAKSACAELAQQGKMPPKLIGVTVLTSFEKGEIPAISLPPSVLAKELAELAVKSGLDGLVSSVGEVALLKKSFPHLKCICPGIRPSWASRNDQRRTATPGEAACAGADWLVIGRPILQADDPLDATQRILAELGSFGEKTSCHN